MRDYRLLDDEKEAQLEIPSVDPIGMTPPDEEETEVDYLKSLSRRLEESQKEKDLKAAIEQEKSPEAQEARDKKGIWGELARSLGTGLSEYGQAGGGEKFKKSTEGVIDSASMQNLKDLQAKLASAKGERQEGFEDEYKLALLRDKLTPQAGEAKTVKLMYKKDGKNTVEFVTPEEALKRGPMEMGSTYSGRVMSRNVDAEQSKRILETELGYTPEEADNFIQDPEALYSFNFDSSGNPIMFLGVGTQTTPLGQVRQTKLKEKAKSEQKEEQLIEDAEAFETTMGDVFDIARELRQQAGKWTGPVAGRAAGVASRLGFSVDPAATELDSFMKKTIFNALKEQSGLTVTDAERIANLLLYPKISDTPEAFEARIAAMKKQMKLEVEKAKRKRYGVTSKTSSQSVEQTPQKNTRRRKVVVKGKPMWEYEDGTFKPRDAQ